MIVVKAELWPHGFEKDAEEIGRVAITNDGCHINDEQGNYTVSIREMLREGPGNVPPFYPEEKRAPVWTGARVEGFERNKHGAFKLLYEALKKIYGESGGDSK